MKIEIGDGTFMDAYGKGKIKVETFVDGKWVACTMNDVLHVPGMQRNLFSIRSVARRGIDFCILREGKNCMFLQNQKIIARGSVIGNLYKVDMRVIIPSVCNLSNRAESNADTLQLWHERLSSKQQTR